VYVWSQRFVPVHVVPFDAAGFEQKPVLVLHVPAAWHGSLAVQTMPWHGANPVWNVKVTLVPAAMADPTKAPVACTLFPSESVPFGTVSNAMICVFAPRDAAGGEPFAPLVPATEIVSWPAG
jgi:hypothetical protein